MAYYVVYRDVSGKREYFCPVCLAWDCGSYWDGTGYTQRICTGCGFVFDDDPLGLKAAENALVEQWVRGTVRFFNRLPGWGRITPDDGGGDYYVYYSDIDGSGYRNLYRGERVLFMADEDEKGLVARKVRRVGT